jgi:hypothetical protein
MTFRDFVVPEDEVFEDVLGVSLTLGEEPYIKSAEVLSPDGFTIHLVYDFISRAISILVTKDGQKVIDIAREAAVSMHVYREAPQIVIRFKSDDTKGSLELGIFPRFYISESQIVF